MANNFFNKIARNVSADLTLPTSVYNVPASTKTIVIELDVANRSTSSQTISVEIEDFSQKGIQVKLPQLNNKGHLPSLFITFQIEIFKGK